MTNEENTILFNGLIKKLNMKDAEETREFLEKFATVFLNSVNSDDERPDRVGREMVEALASNDLKRFCMAVCGWEPASLLEFFLDHEEQKKLIASERAAADLVNENDLVALVAAYEDVYKIPSDKRTTSWFGDYSMWIIRNGYEDEFKRIRSQALNAFCTTEREFRKMSSKEKTSSTMTERLLKFKTVFPKYRFSLVQYEREDDGYVYGVWLQDFTGSFEDACWQAKETEKANSNRIKVAVVEALGNPCPAYEELKLKKLN